MDLERYTAQRQALTETQDFVRKFEKQLPVTEKEYPIGSLEQAKEVLKGLRESKKVVIKNQGILFVGSNIKEVEDLTLEILKEI